MPLDFKKPEGIESLKNEIQYEFEEAKNNAPPQVVTQVNQSEEVLGKLLEKGVEIFGTWSNAKIETEKYAIDKEHEADLKWFEISDRINKRENIIKTILIIVVVISLVILSVFDKLNEGFTALIAIIVMSVLKNDFKDFSKKIYKRLRDDDNDD